MKKQINYQDVIDKINNAKSNNEPNVTYDFGRQANINKVIEIFKDLQNKGYQVRFNHKNRGVQLYIEF